MDFQGMRDVNTRLAPLRKFLADFGAAVDHAMALQGLVHELQGRQRDLQEQNSGLQGEVDVKAVELLDLTAALADLDESKRQMQQDMSALRSRLQDEARREHASLLATLSEERRTAEADFRAVQAQMQERVGQLQQEVRQLEESKQRLLSVLRSVGE